MGYTTYYGDGEISIKPPLNKSQTKYLNKFSKTQHCTRDVAATARLPDPYRIRAKLPLGEHAQFFVGNDSYGPLGDLSVHNGVAPPGVPDFDGEWAIADDGAWLTWIDARTADNAVVWLEYLIATFFKPWGRVLEGKFSFDGSEPFDTGFIYVKNNLVREVQDVVTHPEPDWT